MSGLDSNGASIRLYEIGGVITGSTAATDGGVNAGNTIFTIAVSGTGVVTLTQFAEIDHANNGDTSAPYDDQFAVLATGLVSADGVGDDHRRRRRHRDRQRDHRPWRQHPLCRRRSERGARTPSVYTDDETATTPDATTHLGGTDDYDGTLACGQPYRHADALLRCGRHGRDACCSIRSAVGLHLRAVSPAVRILTIRQLQDGNLIDVRPVTLTNAPAAPTQSSS